jgi:hypothetical protein
MSSLSSNRSACILFAEAALLAACGGSQPPIGAPGAMPQASAVATRAQRDGSWMLPKAKGDDLLYVSASGSSSQVLVLSFPKGNLVGSLAGFTVPTGECVDHAGDVFVTDAGSETVTEYAHGGQSPILTLSDPDEPYGCSVDATTGNLAVTNLGNVAIYPNAQGSPTFYSDPNIGEYEFCAYDKNGNLYVDGTTTDVAELPKNGASFTDISFGGAIAGPGSMQWVNGGLVIVDAGAPWRSPTPIDRVTVSGSKGVVVGTTYLKSHYGAVAAYVQYWIQGRNIVGPERAPGDEHRFLGFWLYPSGKMPSQTLRHLNSGGLWGTVVSVAK